jgi:PPP family 3-phenylpropionic acid transporter
MITFFIPKIRVSSSQKTATLQQIGKFIKNRGVAILLISNVVWSISEASLTGFLFLHIKALGGNSVAMGFSMATALLCELLCFMIIDKIESRFKLSTMILAAFVCQFLRLFFLFIIKDPILLIPFQFIGGASFALIWSASVAYLNQHADKEIGATAQALKNCSTSIGAGLSAIVGGWIYETRGSTNLFLYLTIMLLVALLIGIQIYKKRKWIMRKNQN